MTERQTQVVVTQCVDEQRDVEDVEVEEVDVHA